MEPERAFSQHATFTTTPACDKKKVGGVRDWFFARHRGPHTGPAGQVSDAPQQRTWSRTSRRLIGAMRLAQASFVDKVSFLFRAGNEGRLPRHQAAPTERRGRPRVRPTRAKAWRQECPATGGGV